MRSKSQGPRESVIQTAILQYLRLKGHFAWANKTMGTYDPKIGRFRANTTMLGVPDIIGFHKDKNGQVFFIEVKTKQGKLSEHQARFLETAGEYRVTSFVARSVDDVIKMGF